MCGWNVRVACIPHQLVVVEMQAPHCAAVSTECEPGPGRVRASTPHLVMEGVEGSEQS